MPVSITVEITNRKGLHARAAAKFVKVVGGYSAAITVKKITSGNEEDMPSVVGSSILGLLMLGADPGSKLYISAEGNEAQDVINALKELVENKFGEAE